MNRILKRPMFKRGGSADGITSGLDQKPRQEYSRGTMPDFQLGGLPGFLTGFGLNLLAEPPRGNIFQTAAVAARDPFNQLQKFQTTKAIREDDIAREEKQIADERKFKEAQLEKRLAVEREKIAATERSQEFTYQDYFKQGLERYAGDVNERLKADNFAKYNTEIFPQLKIADIDNSQIGGLIDNPVITDMEKRKKFLSQNKSQIGKIFYDVNSGQLFTINRDAAGNLDVFPFTIGQAMTPPPDADGTDEKETYFGQFDERNPGYRRPPKDVDLSGAGEEFGLGFYDGS